MAGQLANLTGTRELKKATSTRRISDSLAETLKSLCECLALPCHVSWHSRWPEWTVCLSKEALPEADELTAKPRRTSPPPAASLPPACRHTPENTVRIVCQPGAEDSLSVGSPQRTVGSVPKHRRHQKNNARKPRRRLPPACRRLPLACRRTPKTTVRMACQCGAEDSMPVGSSARTVGSVPKYQHNQYKNARHDQELSHSQNEAPPTG